jgi:S-adenosylmethionine-diacylgycerolhomoserine-N-methlytransferase
MCAAPFPDAHARLMDRVYRLQRHVYDFTRKYYLFGRDRLIAGLALEPHSDLLEIGCGTARNLIAIARAYPGTRLCGLDASAAMLETARAAVRRAGLEHRITLAQGLAEQFSPAQFGAAHFENVLFSYSLSMIPDWPAALAAAHAALTPKGRIHIVDFGDLRGLGRPLEHTMRTWLRIFHVTPRVELLTALEKAASDSGNLTLLLGRYAFIFSSGKK